MSGKTLQVRVDNELYDSMVLKRLGEYNGNLSMYVRTLVECDLNDTRPGHLLRLQADIQRGTKYIAFLMVFLFLVLLSVAWGNYLFFIDVMLGGTLFCMAEMVKSVQRKPYNHA